MKWLLLLLMVFCADCAIASYTICPSQVSSAANYSRAWSFLKKLPPRFQWGACTVEIHICDISGVPSEDDIIGDLWIKNQRGREQYVTFFFPKTNNLAVDAGDSWLRYQFQDSHYDETNGKYERVSLSMTSCHGGNTPSRLVLYNYTSAEHDVFLGVFPFAVGSLCYQ